MADFTLIREEGHGYARRLVIRLPEYAWTLQRDQAVMVEIVSNEVLGPEERV